MGFLEKYLALRRCRMANSLIPSKLRKGRILDIGCGLHPFFLLNTDFFDKVGIDQLVKEKDKTKYSDRKIQLEFFDIASRGKLPFKPESFNVVIMLAVIEHLAEKNLTTLMEEIFRVLKKRGVFIYTTPYPSPVVDVLLKFMAVCRILSQEEILDHKEYYGHGRMKKIMSLAGFMPEKMKFGFFELFLNTWGYVEK